MKPYNTFSVIRWEDGFLLPSKTRLRISDLALMKLVSYAKNSRDMYKLATPVGGKR